MGGQWPNEHVNDCNLQETADGEEEDLSMKYKSKVSTTKSQVSKLKCRGHPWPPYMREQLTIPESGPSRFQSVS